MEHLQDLIHTFCTACFAAGIIFRLFPESSAKKCIKAIAGLYILATLVSFDPGMYVPSAILPKPEENGLKTNHEEFEAAVLSYGKRELETQAESTLRQRGIESNVLLTLRQTSNGVVVQSVRLSGVTPEQRNAAESCLQSLFSPAEIVFSDME